MAIIICSSKINIDCLVKVQRPLCSPSYSEARMPVCCRFNGSGRCMSYSCVKAGRPCTDCLPSRKGHCCNEAPSPTHAMTSSTTTADNGHGESLALTGDTPGTMGNDVLNSQDTPCSTSPGRGANASAMFDDVITDINTDTLVETRTLPSFEPVPSITSSWGDISGEKFSKAIDDAYAEVVHWKHNIFLSTI